MVLGEFSPDAGSAILTEVERLTLRDVLRVLEVVVALASLLEALGAERIPELLGRQNELAVPATPLHLRANKNQRCVSAGLHCAS